MVTLFLVENYSLCREISKKNLPVSIMVLIRLSISLACSSACMMSEHMMEESKNRKVSLRP